MKEVTYGWYPSVKDVYRPKGRPSSYHLECLFKYGDSLYYQGQYPPPEPELFVRGVASRSATPSTASERRRKARSLPVPKFSRVPTLHLPTPTQCWASSVPNETQWGVVGDTTAAGMGHTPSNDVTWPLPRNSTQLQKQLQEQKQQQQQQEAERKKYFVERQPTQQYAWGLQPESQSPHPPSIASDNQLDWPLAHNMVPVRPKSSVPPATSTSQKQQLQQSAKGQKARPASTPAKALAARQAKAMTPKPPTTTNKVTATSKRPARVQSATVRREKTPLPARPVTACSNRQTTVEAAMEKLQITEEQLARPPSGIPTRPAAPVPFVYDVNDPTTLGTQEPEDFSYKVEQAQVFEDTDDWDQTLNKYGWRAEVHGDPYGLKKLAKRVSYAVDCPEPEVPPEPPKVHMETNEPFFLNTIPARPLTFAVDKEWMSEVLLAKRLELQKREGGVRYNYKNFAFVY